eukprot:scaffold1878_cov258-Pinguiococcus_pyrenoidosus.AAC.22
MCTAPGRIARKNALSSLATSFKILSLGSMLTTVSQEVATASADAARVKCSVWPKGSPREGSASKPSTGICRAQASGSGASLHHKRQPTTPAHPRDSAPSGCPCGRGQESPRALRMKPAAAAQALAPNLARS